jgi:hypothetical protein
MIYQLFSKNARLPLFQHRQKRFTLIASSPVGTIFIGLAGRYIPYGNGIVTEM